MSLRVFLQGDTEIAQTFVWSAQGLLGRLKTEMSFNSLSQLARTYELESGEIIRVQSFFGQDTITIESPFVEPVVIEEEVVEIPFIIKLMFVGTDGERYFVFWNVDENILLELINIETGAVIEQPISKDDLYDKVAGIAVDETNFSRCVDMPMSEHAPSVDWSETSGGVSSLKTIRLFNLAVRTPWLGGYKTTIEIPPGQGLGIYVVDGRIYDIYFIWVVPGEREWDEDKWYAKVISYDNDLNGLELGLHDIHTNDVYTHTKTGEGSDLIDYYVSHGKVIYSLPNSEVDVRGFCATKTVAMDTHWNESGPDHASGQIKGHLYSPFISEPELFYDESFDTYVTYTSEYSPWIYGVPKEIPNFWIDNISSAITHKGRAIIFEQVVTEKLYEWNGSPFYPAEPYYDLKTTPTYELSGRVWIQKDVERIKDTDATGEAAYDYQWENFTEIDFPAILKLVKAHPKHTGRRRLYAYLYTQ